MYPQFCAFPCHLSYADRYLDAVAADFGLGPLRPGVIVGEAGDALEVMTAADGRRTLLPAREVRRGLSEGAAMALMEAVEEAIEDTLEAEPLDAARLSRLEETLQLMERCLEGPGSLSSDEA
ncbi:MAG TPA: hypothetical protein VNL71_23090 [Chloroflexota bacterium]|nr:hypothetical protein [Chloroflexota bacterium]